MQRFIALLRSRVRKRYKNENIYRYKNMTTKNILNSFSLLSYKNLNRTAMRVALIGLFISLGIGNAWAHDAHYGKAVLKNATGHGTVYLSTASDSNKGQTSSSNPGAKDGTSWITWDCGEDENKDSKTYYARYSAAEDGWYYAGWATAANATSYTASTTGKTFSTSSTNSGSPTTTTIYGYFKPVTVTGAPANVNINATDPLATYPAAGGAVLSFTTANSNKIGDFTTSSSGDAHFVIADWARASASSATFNYKFVGNGSYGETDRTFTKTVTLTSKGDASSTKSCTLTAKYPNPKVVSGDDSDEYTKLFTTFAAIGDQETVTKTIVKPVITTNYRTNNNYTQNRGYSNTNQLKSNSGANNRGIGTGVRTTSTTTSSMNYRGKPGTGSGGEIVKETTTQVKIGSRSQFHNQGKPIVTTSTEKKIYNQSNFLKK